MTEVLLKIMGLNMDGENLEPQVELVTDGELTRQGEDLLLSYEESQVSGMEGQNTHLILSGDSLLMKRSEREGGIETEILFQKGFRHLGLYATPYGPIEVEVLTNELLVNIDDETGGSIKVDYNLSLKGLTEGRNILDIQVDRRQ